MQTRLVTKDIKDPVPALAAPTDRPLDAENADMLITVLNSVFGLDTTAFEDALATGQPADKAKALATLVCDFLFPDPNNPTAKVWAAGQPVDDTAGQQVAPTTAQAATGALPGHPTRARSGEPAVRPKTIGVTGGPGANPRLNPATQKALSLLLKVAQRPKAAQKASSSDPYYQTAVNLTKGWPGSGAA